MSLKLYFKQNEQFVEVSAAGDFASPIATSHNGKTGDSSSVQLYIRNDDSAVYYTNIAIVPSDSVVSSAGSDIDYEHTGWGVKLSNTSEEPSSAEWDALLWANSIATSDIGNFSVGDSVTYVPFWYLITCPPNSNAQTKTDIVINVTYTENTVTS